MLDHEQRIAALEKDAATMKRDIIYKLDDTNSAVTIIRGIVGNQGQDIREIRNQVKIVNVHRWKGNVHERENKGCQHGHRAPAHYPFPVTLPDIRDQGRHPHQILRAEHLAQNNHDQQR